MDELKDCLEKLKLDVNLQKTASYFYKKFGEYKINTKYDDHNLMEIILPKIFKLIDDGVLQKDILYLTLLANRNEDLLQKCAKYSKQIFQLSVDEPSTLFDYCLYKKQHWFNEIISNCNNELPSVFNETILNKIFTLKCIEITNSQCIDLDELQQIIRKVKLELLDPFWQFYIKEINQIITWYKFCEKHSQTLNPTDIFLYSCNNSLLETLSEFLQLNQLEWNEIYDLFQNFESNNTDKSQSFAFTMFYLLSNIIKLINPDEDINHNNVNLIIDKIKTEILGINNLKLQIELLENIFILIFLQQKHLINKNKTKRNINLDKYVCNEREVRLLLYLLKSILDDVKLKNIYNNTPEYKQFTNLNKYVIDASWRMELIMHVKPNQCENNLLNYMLAPPESLIYMCLKQEDINRAYQVIRVSEATIFLIDSLWHVLNFCGHIFHNSLGDT